MGEYFGQENDLWSKREDKSDPAAGDRLPLSLLSDIHLLPPANEWLDNAASLRVAAAPLWDHAPADPLAGA